MNITTFPRRVTIVIAICALITGCGSKGDLATVTGRVTLKGKPLKGAIVEFQPLADEGSSSAGQTDEDGRYKLMYTFKKPGALPGEHLVTIRTAAAFYDDEGEEKVEEQIPDNYNSQSELRRSVETGKNVFDFDL